MGDNDRRKLLGPQIDRLQHHYTGQKTQEPPNYVFHIRDERERAD